MKIFDIMNTSVRMLSSMNSLLNYLIKKTRQKIGTHLFRLLEIVESWVFLELLNILKANKVHPWKSEQTSK